MTQQSDRDHIINQGTLRSERVRVDFYTTCPAPNQWSAVGVLIINSMSGHGDERRRLMVGNGTTEDNAIADLRRQFAEAVKFADNPSIAPAETPVPSRLSPPRYASRRHDETHAPG